MIDPHQSRRCTISLPDTLMLIDRISLTHVRVPMLEPFRISSGICTEKDAIIVAVSAAGLTGHGESSPMAGSFYSTDTPEQSWRELCDIVAPALLGRAFNSPAAWNDALDSLPAGNFTKTGVETVQRPHLPRRQSAGAGPRPEVKSVYRRESFKLGIYEPVSPIVPPSASMAQRGKAAT